MIYIQDYIKKHSPQNIVSSKFPSSDPKSSNLVSFQDPVSNLSVSGTQVAKLVDQLMAMPEPEEKEKMDLGQLYGSDDQYSVVAKKILQEDLS